VIHVFYVFCLSDFPDPKQHYYKKKTPYSEEALV